MKRSVFSSRFLAGFKIFLLLIVTTSLVSVTACSWFRRKKPVVKDVATEVSDSGTNAGSQTTTPGPVGNEREGNVPGSIAPFPELQKVYFDFDKSNIRPDQMPRVEQNLQYLKGHASDKVLIEGHCDERGTVEYNFSLGERRARAIQDYFLKGGIPGERVAIISKGEEEPADPGHSEEAYSKNRRCEFKRMF